MDMKVRGRAYESYIGIFETGAGVLQDSPWGQMGADYLVHSVDCSTCQRLVNSGQNDLSKAVNEIMMGANFQNRFSHKAFLSL